MNWLQGRQTCGWHQTLISTGICAREKSAGKINEVVQKAGNKQRWKDARELKTHIKFSADAALKSKEQVIDGCCMIKVLLFLFFMTEYCTLSLVLTFVVPSAGCT